MSITIFSPSGEAVEYRTVSERLPDFQKLFPLVDGYRIIRSHRSDSEFNCISTLWSEALKAGKNPRDLGLPVIYGMGMVFEAHLYLKETLIANASAYKNVTNPKDWEAGETAAFQRLMAACGLGGTDMDMDDQYDRISSGLERKPDPQRNQAVQKDTSKPDVVNEPSHDDAQKVEPELHAQAPTQEPAIQVDPSSSTTPTSTADTRSLSPSSADDAIRPQLLNQLNHAASLAGEPVPQVADNAEAKKEIKRLTRKAQGK